MWNKARKKGGYTIIETMISVSLFLVILLAGIGAVLNANLLSNKSEDLRSITDNLTFIMEEISRNLRTGYTYHCIDDGDFTNLDFGDSCEVGGAIAFEEAFGDPADGGDQWVYKIESVDGGQTYDISKSVDSGLTWTQLNIPEITLTSTSSFSVLGAEPPPGDTQQPHVIIRLIGEIDHRGSVSTFSMQTSIASRLVDIAP